MADGHLLCSDEEAERLGLGTLAFLVLIGISCFLVPRLGGWETRLVGVSHYVYVVGAACVLVAGYTYLMGGPSSEDADKVPCRDSSGSAAACGGADVAGVPETDMAADGAPANALGEELRRRQLLMTPNMSAAPAAGDPMWDADWADLAKLIRTDSQQLQRPVEVFELNDTPTWLARLQQRRTQALRSGKQKLVQKIDKEIADARKAHAMAQSLQESRGVPAGFPAAPAAADARGGERGGQAKPSRQDSGGPPGAAAAPAAASLPGTGAAEAHRQMSDDVYGLDWAAFTAEGAHPQTVIAA